MAQACAKVLGVFLTVDTEKKLWRIDSIPMFHPENQVRDYSDITAIFKSDPRTFTVSEERDPAGHLVRFVVST